MSTKEAAMTETKEVEGIDDIVQKLVNLYDDDRIREVVARAKVIYFDSGYAKGYEAGYESGQASE